MGGFGNIPSFLGALISIGGALGGQPWMVALGFGLMTAGGLISSNETKKEAMEKAKRETAGLRANTQTSERPIPVIYGRQRVGGNVVWASTEGRGSWTAMEPRSRLLIVFGICEGPIDAFEEMFFNDMKVWDASSGQLKTMYLNKFAFDWRTGTNSQAPFTRIASEYRLYDVASDTFPMTAMTLVELFYDKDVYSGIPQITWTIRGKQIPDWTNASSPGVLGWSQSGPLQAADIMTDRVYGMGMPSSKILVSDLRSSHAYATAVVAVGSREIVETVDTSGQRPKYWEQVLQVPAYTSLGGLLEWLDQDPTNTLWPFRMGSRLPIRPGSLSMLSPFGSAYKDVPRSGWISEFGQIASDPGGTAVGSINYLTGSVLLEKPPLTARVIVQNWTARFYADWEFSHRTRYTSIARSAYVVSTPETLVETGTVAGNVVTLWSSQGGGGTLNYATGELSAFFGAHEWYDNRPVEVRYRVQTRARLECNFPLFEATRVGDAVREIQQHYRGFLSTAGGAYGIGLDRPEASTFSFDEDNIVAGSFSFSQPSVREIPSRVTIKFVDRLADYRPAEASFDARSSAVGDDVEHVLSLPGLTGRDQANAMGYTYANIANNLRTSAAWRAAVDPSSFRAGQVVDVTHDAAAWSGKLFRLATIAFAENDQIAFTAVEHDPSVYVDDWVDGPMQGPNPSFFPRRSAWPPNVSSVALSEIVRTMADGTSVPAIKFQIHAVDSPALTVDGWRVYVTNAERGQARRVGYSGVGTIGYVSPVEPGWTWVDACAVSAFGNESPRAWTGSLEVRGTLEYEWQNWRLEKIKENVNLVSGMYGNAFCQVQSWSDFYFMTTMYPQDRKLHKRTISNYAVNNNVGVVITQFAVGMVLGRVDVFPASGTNHALVTEIGSASGTPGINARFGTNGASVLVNDTVISSGDAPTVACDLTGTAFCFFVNSGVVRWVRFNASSVGGTFQTMSFTSPASFCVVGSHSSVGSICLSATWTRSGGVLLMTAFDNPSSGYYVPKALAWRFDDPSSPFVTGSLAFRAGTGSWPLASQGYWRLSVCGDDPFLIPFAMNLWQTTSPGREDAGKYVGYFSAASLGMVRIYPDIADRLDVASTGAYYGHLIGRPIFFGGLLRTTRTSGTDPNSPGLVQNDFDTYRLRRINTQSLSFMEYVTW